MQHIKTIKYFRFRAKRKMFFYSEPILEYTITSYYDNADVQIVHSKLLNINVIFNSLYFSIKHR